MSKENTKAFEDGRMGRERLSFQSDSYNRRFDEGALHRTLSAYVKYASVQATTLTELVRSTGMPQRTLDAWYKDRKKRRRLNTLIAGAALRADRSVGRVVMHRIDILEEQNNE